MVDVDVPWESEESRNYICMRKIVTDVVSEGLRIVFKREWNSRYQASLGAWDDTTASGAQLYHSEKARKRPNMKDYQSNFQHGETNRWDCSVLFDAILYSNSIGSTLNPIMKTEVDKLRIIRNKIMHPHGEATLTDLEFQNMTSDVENSFKALSLPNDNITSIKSKRNRHKSFQILPPKPTHEVVYRSEKINEIKQDLQKLRDDNDGKLTYFYISGNPGSGKSQLSRHLGEDLYKSIDWHANATFVMTLDASNLDSLLNSYEDFSRRLNCNEDVLKSVMNSSKPKQEKIKDLRSEIATRIQNWKSWWIIVDNAEDLDKIYPLLPQMGDVIWNNGQIIVTVQNSTSVPPISLSTKHISLSGGMNKRECRQLFSSLSGTVADDLLLDEVADKLDHQPLAMAAAAIYIQRLKQKEFSWRDYLEKLEKGKRPVTEEQLQKTSSAYSFTMSAAVHLAVQKAAENEFILNETFKLFALISFEPLPIDIIVKYIQQLDRNYEKEEICLAIKQCSLFLLTENENDVRLHRVVHDEATKLSSNHQANEMQYNSQSEIVNERSIVYNVAKALYCFKDRDDKIKILPHLKSFNAIKNELVFEQELSDSNGSVLKDHEIAKMYIFFGQILRSNYQLKLALEFFNVSLQVWRNSDKDLAHVLCEFGQTHYLSGEYNESKDYHQRAIEIRMNVLGPNHINVATSYNNLGLVYKAMGKLEQAKDYHQRAIEIRMNVLGPNHIEVAKSYNDLGLVYETMGELEQAKDYHQRALEIKIKVLGPNHINVATSYDNLGSVCEAMGELEQAKDYQQRAREIRINVLGPNHIDVATSYNNLGSVYKAMGELEQAKDYHQRAIEIEMNVLGPNHINVATSYNNLGSVNKAMGELEQAKDYHQRAIEIEMNVLGPNHINVATSYNNLGSVNKAMGELEQAKDYHQRAIEIRMNVLGPNHISVATSYNNLGLVHETMGELEQAKDCHQRAMEIYINVLGPNHIYVATSYDNLGSVCEAMDEVEQAKDYHERAIEIRMNVLGPNHNEVATSYNNLGLVYEAMGKLEQAKDYHQRALEIKMNVLGPNHIDVSTSYNNLGLVYKAMGELEQAKDYLERPIEITINVLGPNHIDVGTSYDNLGSVYESMGELEQAKDYHQRAIEITINVFGPNHVHVATSYNNLGLLYKAMGELEQAKDYYQRAIEIYINVLGPNHIHVATSYNNLGSVYEAMDELEQAKDYHQRAIEIKINVLGPNHIKVATSYNNLGSVYEAMGQLEQARDYHQRAIEIGLKP